MLVMVLKTVATLVSVWVEKAQVLIVAGVLIVDRSWFVGSVIEAT